MKFSVVIPYYRSLTTIERALRSVLNQTLPPHEVVLVDDGSLDAVEEATRALQRRLVEEKVDFHLIRMPQNGGPSAARNLGWDRAVGDYVAFLDADDMWHPQKLEICAFFIARHDPVAIFHESRVVGDDAAAAQPAACTCKQEDFRCTEVPLRKWLVRNQASTPSVVVKKNLDDRFDPLLRFCEDHDLWLRIAIRHGQWRKLKGPSLTLLGRPSLTAGGHSSKIHRMRIGEMRMYGKFARRSWWAAAIFPFLISLSLTKHVYLILRLQFKRRVSA